MKPIKIRPNDGHKVYNPETKKYLADDGEYVQKDHYWTRRLVDNSVVEISENPIDTKEVLLKKKRTPRERTQE